MARELGVDIESVCGGHSACGKCRVRLEEGSERGTSHASAPTPLETSMLGASELSAGTRLACQTCVLGDLSVYVPEESRRTAQIVRKEASAREVTVDAAIKKYRVRVSPPTLEDATGLADNLVSALQEQHGLPPLAVDLHVLQDLGRVGQDAGWDLIATVWQDRALIALDAADLCERAGGPSDGPAESHCEGPAVRPSEGRAEGRPSSGEPAHALGLAVDVGTTTIAAYLTDLVTGQVVATESAMNPQVAFGEDVIARMGFVRHEQDGLLRMQKAAVDEVGRLAVKAADRVGRSQQEIMDVVVVGNTVMHHLFLGLDPRSLSMAPFSPVVTEPVDVMAREVGLAFHPGCRLHTLAIEAGFVGADNVAVILAEGPHRQDELLLVIDIGTNGELVLGDRERLFSASCATGPALEGAHIEFGVRATAGAIERVRIDPETLDVRFKVIGTADWSDKCEQAQLRARGICGSGIIDAVAQMLAAGVILKTGNFNPDRAHERILLENGRPVKFVLAWPEQTALGRSITISLKDVRAVQLAKAALYAGAKTLLRRYGAETPHRIVLAGAFGSYIDPIQAMSIGLLPDCDPDMVASVGNAAGHGARLALVNLGKRLEAAEVARQVEYVELATDPEFQREYIEAIHMPHMCDTFPRLNRSLAAGRPD